MAKVFCFGDSFGAGAELKKGEYPFVKWFSSELGLLFINYSVEGASLGIILHKLIVNHLKITKDDIVLVIIPPDSRWYDENEKDGFYSLSNYMKEDYYIKFLNKKTLEWFEYHHSLFIYTIQKILDDIGCYYCMAHNYGRIGGKHYNLNIDYSKFLSETDLINLLASKPIEWDNYPHNIEPKEHRFMYDGPPAIHDHDSPYLYGTLGHPNELGHKYIAKLFLEKYYQDKNESSNSISRLPK